MSIKSSAFGRVTLTETDARKFVNQVRYGRPSKAAVQSLKAGTRLADEFDAKGFLKLYPAKSEKADKAGG